MQLELTSVVEHSFREQGAVPCDIPWRAQGMSAKPCRMYKRQFECLAEVLREVPSEGQYETWRACVDAIADLCAESNPRFNRTRFLKACGLGSEGS